MEASAPEPARPPAAIAGGPSGLEMFSVLRRFRRAPLKELRAIHQRYGDVVRATVPTLIHFVASPAGAKHVLQDRHTNYGKGFEYERMKALVGEGLLTSEGALWKRQRRLAQPAFHRQRIASFAGQMADVTARQLEGWSRAPDAPRDLSEEMTELTLGVLGPTVFAADLTAMKDRISPAASVVVQVINRRMDALWPIPLWVPTPDNLKFVRARRALDEVVYSLINERRGGKPEERGDLVSMLMAARDEDTGEGMSDQQLRDEVMTMLLAGHETTANALSWAFHLLMDHPEMQERLHHEVRTVVGDGTPALEHLPRLEWITHVLEEAMRLYPPAWIFSRRALADDEIGGFAIPQGSTVVITPYHLHRDPRFWEDPDRFDPSRFTAERSAGRNRFVYIPFAAGPRQCIGNSFAMMEMQIALAMVVQRFRLERVPGRAVEPEPLVTLRPKHGIWGFTRPRA